MGFLSDIEAREAFHMLFLEHLQRHCDPRLVVLKGGVNLRFFLGSPRYSEDLDLDVLGGAPATLAKNCYKILRSTLFRRGLGAFGIVDLLLSDPSKAKQTDTTQRFKLRLVNQAGEQLPTKVEFSRREAGDPFVQDLLPPAVAARYHRIAFRCQHYPGPSAARQKLRALAGRPITQARDFFDLFLLHAGNHMREDVIETLEPNVLHTAKARLGAVSYAQYTDQVVAYLARVERPTYEKVETFVAMRQALLAELS